MKLSLKYFACVSAVGFALVGTACTKKDNPEPQAEAEVEVVIPEVVERAVVVCDDVALKNRVVALVQDELYSSAMQGLGKGATETLSQQLKARLSGVEIDLQNIQEQDGECISQLHVVLPPQEIETANKTFKAAGVASLEDQAIKNNISLMGGSRLVGDFKFATDGEALVIDDNNTVIALVSETMATAVRSMVRTNQANAKRETAEIGRDNSDIIPAPTVQIRPVELPSIPQNNPVPTPESAILQPEDVPSGTPQQGETVARAEKSTAERARAVAPNRVETDSATSTPKVEPTASEPVPSDGNDEPKPTPKAEPKPEEPSKSAGHEITIVETNDTY